MTAISTHEKFSHRDEVKGGSDRGFGLTVGGILAAIAIVNMLLSEEGRLGWFMPTLLAAGVALVVLGIVAPTRLAPLNRAWTALSLILFKIVNPLVLGIMFFLVVLPIGLLMRLFGKDPLRLKFDREAPTYWIDKEPLGPAKETMRNQF